MVGGMTGLAARLVIPAPLQAAWTIAKPLLPYLGCAIAALLLVLHFEGVGERRQKDRDAKAIAAITQQRDSWISAFHQSDANFHAAIDIVNQQNAQSLARARAFDQAKADWAAADKANNEAWEKSQAARKALAEIAAHGASGCKASKALTDALEDL